MPIHRRGRPAVLAVAGLLAFPAAAIEMSCDGTLLTVSAETTPLAARVCSVAGAFLDSVETCDLRVRSPVSIAVTDQIDPEQPDCIAKFRCVAGELMIVPPDRLAEIDIFDAPFAAIPTEAFFDSIIAHELTHGLLFQTAPEVTRVQQEYLAHALQIWVLPDAVRADFVEDTRFDGPPEALISLPVLRFFPAYFASASWAHFEKAGGLCSAVDEVLEARTPF